MKYFATSLGVDDAWVGTGYYLFGFELSGGWFDLGDNIRDPDVRTSYSQFNFLVYSLKKSNSVI